MTLGHQHDDVGQIHMVISCTDYDTDHAVQIQLIKQMHISFDMREGRMRVSIYCTNTKWRDYQWHYACKNTSWRLALIFRCEFVKSALPTHMHMYYRKSTLAARVQNAHEPHANVDVCTTIHTCICMYICMYMSLHSREIFRQCLKSHLNVGGPSSDKLISECGQLTQSNQIKLSCV